jgi:histidyl-tRNA synthetase
MRKTLKLRLITAAQFEQFFLLDSPGYFIARDAMNAGETSTATDALEVLCLANELYESELLNRLIVELAPYGQVEEYAEKRGTDEGADLIVEVLGKDRALRILQDVANEVKRQSKVGTGENDKVKASDPFDLR